MLWYYWKNCWSQDNSDSCKSFSVHLCVVRLPGNRFAPLNGCCQLFPCVSPGCPLTATLFFKLPAVSSASVHPSGVREFPVYSKVEAPVLFIVEGTVEEGQTVASDILLYEFDVAVDQVHVFCEGLHYLAFNCDPCVNHRSVPMACSCSSEGIQICCLRFLCRCWRQRGYWWAQGTAMIRSVESPVVLEIVHKNTQDYLPVNSIWLSL